MRFGRMASMTRPTFSFSSSTTAATTYRQSGRISISPTSFRARGLPPTISKRSAKRRLLSSQYAIARIGRNGPKTTPITTRALDPSTSPANRTLGTSMENRITTGMAAQSARGTRPRSASKLRMTRKL